MNEICSQINSDIQAISPSKIKDLRLGKLALLSLRIISIKETHFGLDENYKCFTLFSDGNEYIALEEKGESMIAGKFNEGDTVDFIIIGYKRQRDSIKSNERKLKLDASKVLNVTLSERNITEHKCYSVSHFSENEPEQKTLVDIECVVDDLETERNSANFHCIDRNLDDISIMANLKISANFDNKNYIRIKRCVIEKTKGRLLITSFICTEIEVIEKFKDNSQQENDSGVNNTIGCSAGSTEFNWAEINKADKNGQSVNIKGTLVEPNLKLMNTTNNPYISLKIMDDLSVKNCCQIFYLKNLKPLIEAESFDDAKDKLEKLKNEKISLNIIVKHKESGSFFHVNSLNYTNDF